MSAWWGPYFTEVASTLTVVGIAAIIRGVWKINQHLATLNGRMGSVETRQLDHEKDDDRRHTDVTRVQTEHTELLYELKGRIA